MGLGFHVTVYRQPDGGASPATFESPTGRRVAMWETSLWGLDWLDELAKEGKAVNLGVEVLLGRYTAPAQHILPRIAGGAPGAHPKVSMTGGDISTMKFIDGTNIDRAELDACRPDEWLVIEAWDQS